MIWLYQPCGKPIIQSAQGNLKCNGYLQSGVVLKQSDSRFLEFHGTSEADDPFSDRFHSAAAMSQYQRHVLTMKLQSKKDGGIYTMPAIGRFNQSLQTSLASDDLYL